MPDKLLQLADVYQPNQQMGNTINMMQLLQQSQRLGLEQQQVGLEQQRVDLQDDRLRQQHESEMWRLEHASLREDKNIPSSVLLAHNNAQLTKQGLPPMTAREYGAIEPVLNHLYETEFNPQTGKTEFLVKLGTPEGESQIQEALRDMTRLAPEWGARVREAVKDRQALQGMQQLGTAAGRPLTIEGAMAVSKSPHLQQELGQAAFPTAGETAAAAKTRAETAKLDEEAVQRKWIMRPMIEANSSSMANLDLAERALPSATLLQDLSKLDPSARQAILNSNPAAKAYLQTMPQLAQQTSAKLGTSLKALHETNKQINLAQAEVPPATEEQLAPLRSRAQQILQQVNLQQAEVNYYLTPYDATARVTWQAETQRAQDYVAGLQQQQADTAAQRLAFDVGKERRAVGEMQKLGKAQAEFVAGDKTLESAGKLAAKYGVLTEDVLKAGKDPTKAGQITLNISPGERKDIAEERAGLREVQEVKALYQDKFVGMFDNFVAKLAGPLNQLSPKEAEFRASVKKMGAGLRKFYAGTAQSKQELKNLIESIPDTDMAETQFTASMSATERNIKRLLEERVAVGQEVGARTPGAKPSGTKADPRREQLRKSFPGVSDEVIQQFLEGR